MDAPDISQGGGGGGPKEGERIAFRILLRCGLNIIFSLAASFLFSFLFGLVAVAIGSFSNSGPVSLPSLCRIVSSSVDIKSSKVCELGLLNYKAKHVFYPLGKTRFRCRDDYYWASVFEVEYKEYFSDQILHAVAEAPKEALPHDCRPGFGTAWSIKMKFKVNETYNCRYTLGSRKADIYPDDLFNCQAEDPSTVEMIRRTSILFTKSFTHDKGTSGRKMAYSVAGIVLGMLASMCCIILFKSLKISALAVAGWWDAKKHRARVIATRFRRACFLVAYVSAMIWIMLQYQKMIGLKQLSLGSILWGRMM